VGLREVAGPRSGRRSTKESAAAQQRDRAKAQAKQQCGLKAPYVLFNSNGPGTVTLDFHNPYNSAPAEFEYRIDGIADEVSPTHENPNIGGNDITYPTITLDTRGVGPIQFLDQTFTATQYVDVRLALGGERDLNFDWVRFYVQPQAVQAIPTLSQWSLILLAMLVAGLAVWRRKRMA